MAKLTSWFQVFKILPPKAELALLLGVTVLKELVCVMTVPCGCMFTVSVWFELSQCQKLLDCDLCLLCTLFCVCFPSYFSLER